MQQMFSTADKRAEMGLAPLVASCILSPSVLLCRKIAKTMLLAVVSDEWTALFVVFKAWV